MRLIRLTTILALIMILPACSWFKDNEKVDDTVPAKTLYSQAKKELSGNNWEAAIKQYEALRARYPYGPYAQQAELELAYAYYKYNEPESAIVAADRFIYDYPTHANVDYAYYLKGLANFRDYQSFMERISGGYDFSERDPKAALAAYQNFAELVEKFPDSRYADDSRLRMAFILEALAAHEIKVARFYYKIDAFVAAINRCKYVIENYQRTPAIEDALGLQATIYARIGMPELAQDNLRVLQLNFPDSRYIGRVQKMLAETTADASS
jgi:outer membrane protein assembly factor BamD